MPQQMIMWEIYLYIFRNIFNLNKWILKVTLQEVILIYINIFVTFTYNPNSVLATSQEVWAWKREKGVGFDECWLRWGQKLIVE